MGRLPTCYALSPPHSPSRRKAGEQGRQVAGAGGRLGPRTGHAPFDGTTGTKIESRLLEREAPSLGHPSPIGNPASGHSNPYDEVVLCRCLQVPGPSHSIPPHLTPSPWPTEDNFRDPSHSSSPGTRPRFCSPINPVKRRLPGGAWVAPSVRHPTLDHDVTVPEFESRVSLCADSSEPAWDSLSLPLSLPLLHLLSLSLSQSK